MRRGQRVNVEKAPPLDTELPPDTKDTAPAAEESEVLEILEAEAEAEAEAVGDDDALRAPIGIRNGVLVGAAIWAVALLALAAISYL